MLTTSELEARWLAMTIKSGAWLLALMILLGAVLAFIYLRNAQKEEANRHAEATQSILASQNIGQTAWSNADVHKSEIIRQQAKRIAELEGWKARTVERMKELHMADQVWGKEHA